MERDAPDPHPAPAGDAVVGDLERLVHLSETLAGWVEEVEVGGAEPADLLPLCELVREYAGAVLLPALNATIGPHLLAVGVLDALPPPHGPGEDRELAGALTWLGATADAGETLLAAKALERALSARVRHERPLIEACGRLPEPARAALARRVERSHPELAACRGRVGRLLDHLDWPGRAA